MKRVKNWTSMAALAALASTAQAALISQGDGTVLDSTTHLVWLQDWNVNGGQTWATQKAWAENLSLAGSSDWVLPAISDYQALFAEFGNLTLLPQFMHVRPNGYWSSTESIPGVKAFDFGPAGGLQGHSVLGLSLFAVAVRPADVAAAVPEPQTLALALLALGAAVAARKRRPA